MADVASGRYIYLNKQTLARMPQTFTLRTQAIFRGAHLA
jgi:hypothetical protein